MLGPFRSVEPPGRGVVPTAWGGKFMLQVRVGAEFRDGQVLHLPEAACHRWLVYESAKQFAQGLNQEQARNAAARATAPTAHRAPAPRPAPCPAPRSWRASAGKPPWA